MQDIKHGVFNFVKHISALGFMDLQLLIKQSIDWQDAARSH